MKTEYFIYKENGKLYWIQEMPIHFFSDAPSWRNSKMFMESVDLQSEVSNSIEVVNQQLLINRLLVKLNWRPTEYRFEVGEIYSIECEVIIGLYGVHSHPTAMVSFPFTEQPTQEAKPDFETCKNDVAKKHGFDNFQECYFMGLETCAKELIKYCGEAAELYTQRLQQQLSFLQPDHKGEYFIKGVANQSHPDITIIIRIKGSDQRKKWSDQQKLDAKIWMIEERDRLNYFINDL